MIELVIVVVIIGVVSAIAIPRMASASEHSRIASVKASLKVLDTAAEMYAAEHGGLLPCHDADGSVDTNAIAFFKRLTRQTTADGALTGTLYGPYLRDIPMNPYNGLRTVRIDGRVAGTVGAGWRFDSVLRRFQADDPVGATITYEPATAAAVGGSEVGDPAAATSINPIELSATAIGGLD